MRYRIPRAVPLAVACFLAVHGHAAVLKQVTDEKQVGFSRASLDDAGTWAFAAATADLGGVNPEHRPQLARWAPSTGAGSLLTAFPKGVSLRRFAASDDGQWVLLLSSSNPVGTNPGFRPQLFLYRTDGGETRQLTVAAAGEPAPETWALSGSANRAVLVSRANLTGANPSRFPQLFVVNADGTGLLQLTSNSTSASYEPSISDDGQRIAFTHAGNPTGGNADLSSELFAIEASGAGLRQLTTSNGTFYGVMRPMMSGNGAKIVFDSQENIASKNNTAMAQIWTINWDGTGIARLTVNTVNNQGAAGYPSVTDDGVWIAYSQQRITTGNPDGSQEIWKIKSDGTGEAQLTSTSSGSNLFPEFSGDGSRIVFHTGGPIGGLNTDGGFALIAMDSSGGTLRLLLEAVPVRAGLPDLAADGSRAFFTGTSNALGTNPDRREQLFRIETAGTGLTQLTSLSDQAWLWHPTASAGGEWVAFVSDANPFAQNSGNRSQLFAVRGDGTDLRQLTPYSGLTGPGQGAPAIAGNASFVVFQAAANYTGGNPDTSAELFRVRTDGTGMLQLTSDDDGAYKLPRVDASGTWIVFQRTIAARTQIFRIRTDGTGLEQITSDTTYRSIEPDISDAGDRIVYISEADPLGTNPEHNWEVFTYDPGTGTRRQLTATTTGTASRPRLSGDGGWVVFVSNAPLFGTSPAEGNDAFRVRVTDGYLERIGGFGAALYSGSWRNQNIPVSSQDGSKVAFATSPDPADTNPDGNDELYLADQTAVPAIRVGRAAPTFVSWDAEPKPRTFDLVRGNVASLALGGGSTVDLGAVVCVENDSNDRSNREIEDATQPAPGQAFFYLRRGTQGPTDGAGSYGQGTGARERVAASGDCPG